MTVGEREGKQGGQLPDRLGIRLSVSLASQPHDQLDDFGWECWYTTILAGWDTFEDPERQAEIVANLESILPESRLQADPEGVEAEIGSCELMLLRLDVPHAVFGDDVLVESGGESILEAADELAQDLVDLIGPLVDLDGENPFIEQVMSASEHRSYDELLIVRTVQISPQFRGMGIGAWAVARAIHRLAPASTTLVALKAAPLSREDFLRDVSDSDSLHELAPDQQTAWTAACERIAANWRRHLGVQSLRGRPEILFAAGGVNDRVAATLAAWRPGRA